MQKTSCRCDPVACDRTTRDHNPHRENHARLLLPRPDPAQAVRMVLICALKNKPLQPCRVVQLLLSYPPLGSSKCSASRGYKSGHSTDSIYFPIHLIAACYRPGGVVFQLSRRLGRDGFGGERFYNIFGVQCRFPTAPPQNTLGPNDDAHRRPPRDTTDRPAPATSKTLSLKKQFRSLPRPRKLYRTSFPQARRASHTRSCRSTSQINLGIAPREFSPGPTSESYSLLPLNLAD